MTTIIDEGGLERLASELGALGTRRILLLVSGRRRFVDAVSSALSRFELTVFDGARVHVPAEVVVAASQVVEDSKPDTLVALGGGAAIGLGKALRLQNALRFVAIPTTYSGSEMTSIYGVTRGGDKQTGRDDRVRPDLVLHDVSFTRDLPIGLSVQGLYNALGHVTSLLSTGTLQGSDRPAALRTLAALVDCTQDLLLFPGSVPARQSALAAAAEAGRLLEAGKTGMQHALAHFLGGRFGLEHSALHSILLPQFMAWVAAEQPALADELEQASGRRDLPALLFDSLMRAGAPVGLGALGVPADALEHALAERPELPREVAWSAYWGLRPSRANRVREEAVEWGPELSAARRVVVAIHGRGANAGTILRRLKEILGDDDGTTVLALRSGTDRWYARRYLDPEPDRDPEVRASLERIGRAVDRARREAPGVPVFLFGFSQGACLALELAARQGAGLAGVLAPSGARLGRPTEWSPGLGLDGVQVLLGASAHDPYVMDADIEATRAWFAAAGAEVELQPTTGEAHEITARQRRRLRALVLGQAPATVPPGFRNAHESEALPGALPRGRNSPRRAPYELYPEQVNGTGFVAPRSENLRTWCYRIRPSAERRPFRPLAHPTFVGDFTDLPAEVNLVGIPPRGVEGKAADFVDGIVTVGGAGAAALRRGYAIHLYAAGRSMEHRSFYDADGDLLLVPEQGELELWTELGVLEVSPGEIALLPRGLPFSVMLRDGFARGYLAEVFGRHFTLPERGPVGANGLVDPRHFRPPAAWFEDRLDPGFRITARLGGRLHEATQDHSPYDVVAWHGNYVPYVYDLACFSPVANARFDHADPSIYTVLTAPLDEQGAHSLDLVVFVPRWDVTEGTFRPPYFHRNVTTEINGIIRQPQSRPGASPFVPGVCYITPAMTAHGVRAAAAERGRAEGPGQDEPMRLSESSLWFQFETALPISLTPWAEGARDPSWSGVWGSYRARFKR